MVETRVALIAILIKDINASAKINEILHEYAEFVIGRMGLPYHKKKINIISVALDAPQDKISAISGKIGSLKGVSTKTTYSDF